MHSLIIGNCQCTELLLSGIDERHHIEPNKSNQLRVTWQILFNTATSMIILRRQFKRFNDVQVGVVVVAIAAGPTCIKSCWHVVTTVTATVCQREYKVYPSNSLYNFEIITALCCSNFMNIQSKIPLSFAARCYCLPAFCCVRTTPNYHLWLLWWKIMRTCIDGNKGL